MYLYLSEPILRKKIEPCLRLFSLNVPNLLSDSFKKVKNSLNSSFVNKVDSE